MSLAGREDLLADLHSRLTSQQPGPQLIALCGLGGAGKTSAAIEYAHRHLAEVAVCWQLSAEDPTVLAAEFAELAAQLGARDVVDSRDPVAAVHAVLARMEAGWLLIFDNAVDRASIEKFLPPAGPGRVLITTQNQHWPASQALDVLVLGHGVAVDFLINRTGDSDRTAASGLAAEMDGLPLALEQAASYIQATGTTLASYLALFSDRQADLLGRGEAIGHPTHVATTLGLALSRLADEAPAAVGLLRILAFLAPEPVPISLLLTKQATSQLSPKVLTTVRSLLADPVALGDAISSLRRYSLTSPAGSGLLLVHRLAQAVTRAQLTTVQARQWRKAAATLVENAVPADTQLPASWPTCAALLPHARTALDLVSAGIWQLAQYLGYSGSYLAAQDLSRLIAEACASSDAYGPEHPDTLIARGNLARWTGDVGDVAAARDQYATLLPALEQVLGPDDLETLVARGNLAYWIGIGGDTAGARDQYAAMLAIHERAHGPEHPATLTARGNLARWTGEAGDAAAARDQIVVLLPIIERVRGIEHPHTLMIRASLARWTGLAGDAVSARNQLANLLPIRERVLGSEHPETLDTRTLLAIWTGEAGDATGARDQFAALLPIRERILGPEHPDTVHNREELAHWTGQAEIPSVRGGSGAGLLSPGGPGRVVRGGGSCR